MDETPGQDGTGGAPLPPGSLGVVIVDHGSRRQDANRRHEDFVRAWAARSAHPVVEAAPTPSCAPPSSLRPATPWARATPALAPRPPPPHPGPPHLVSAPPGPH